MPNWTENTIIVEGDKQNIKEFCDWLDEIITLEYTFVDMPDEDGKSKTESKVEKLSGFTFHKIVPVPKPIYDMYWTASGTSSDGKRFGDSKNNWYNWNNTNWGTKWDCSDVSVTHSDDAVEIIFMTAWCAPTPIFNALKAKFPDLDFDYYWVDEEDWE